MKKEINGKLTKADHNPLRVGNNFTMLTNSGGNNGGNNGGKSGGGNKKSKPQHKTLEERVANVINATVPKMITEAVAKAIKPLVEFNKKQRKLNEKFIEYMDKHP